MVFNAWIVIYSLIMSLKRKQLYYLLIMGITMIRAFTDETSYCFMPVWICVFLELYENACPEQTMN